MPDTCTPIRPSRRQLLLTHQNRHHYYYYFTTTGIHQTKNSISVAVVPVTKVRKTKSTLTTTSSFLFLFVWYNIYCSIGCYIVDNINNIPPHLIISTTITMMMRFTLLLQSASHLNKSRTATITPAILLPTVSALPLSLQYTTNTFRQTSSTSTSSIQYPSVRYSRNHERLQPSFIITTTTTRCSSTTHLSSSTTTALTSVDNSSNRIPADTTTPPIVLQHIEFKSTTTTNAPVHLNEQQQQEQPVVIFLHGLLGNKRNFASIGRSIAASSSSSSNAARSRIIYSLDLRNHGDTYLSNMKQNHHETDLATSSWMMDMSYRTMAYDVIHFCNVHNITQIDTLIGHSIGGKVAQYVSSRLNSLG